MTMLGGKHLYTAINVSPLEMKFEDVGDYMIEKAKKESLEQVQEQETKQMQALNQKEMIRGQDMGYSINFDDMKNIEGDKLNIKLRTPVRNLELAEQKMNKFLVDSLTRFMNTANLMQNNITEEDQVGMVIWDILPNLVKRLQ